MGLRKRRGKLNWRGKNRDVRGRSWGLQRNRSSWDWSGKNGHVRGGEKIGACG